MRCSAPALLRRCLRGRPPRRAAALAGTDHVASRSAKPRIIQTGRGRRVFQDIIPPCALSQRRALASRWEPTGRFRSSEELARARVAVSHSGARTPLLGVRAPKARGFTVATSCRRWVRCVWVSAVLFDDRSLANARPFTGAAGPKDVCADEIAGRAGATSAAKNDEPSSPLRRPGAPPAQTAVLRSKWPFVRGLGPLQANEREGQAHTQGRRRHRPRARRLHLGNTAPARPAHSAERRRGRRAVEDVGVDHRRAHRRCAPSGRALRAMS